MINQQVLQGNWNELKGKIRSKWGQLTNDDLQNFDGNVDAQDFVALSQNFNATLAPPAAPVLGSLSPSRGLATECPVARCLRYTGKMTARRTCRMLRESF